MPVGPVIICSGPGTQAIGMNGAGNALGQGNRANLTIGRAVQLVVRNVGGGRPQGVDRATHGNPGKLSFCFCEHPESPFTTLAESRGATPGADALTVFAGEGPRCVVDQKVARAREPLVRSLAACLQTVHHPKLVLGFDAVLVLGPEHGRVFHEAGWDRDADRRRADRRRHDAGRRARRRRRRHGRGPARAVRRRRRCRSSSDGGILLAYAGGGAGLFSAIIGGWANGAIGSTAGHQGGAPMTHDGTCSIRRASAQLAERQRLDRPAVDRRQARSACSTSPSRAATSSSISSSVRLTDAGAKVMRFAKPTFTKPAPVDLRHEIATQCDLVIEALAD